MVLGKFLASYSTDELTKRWAVFSWFDIDRFIVSDFIQALAYTVKWPLSLYGFHFHTIPWRPMILLQLLWLSMKYRKTSP